MALPLQSAAEVDPESLQRENDRGIEALGERVSMLRNVSSGVQRAGSRAVRGSH